MPDRDLEWRQLTGEEREREYSPSSCVGGDIEPFLTEYGRHSEASRRWCAEQEIPVLTLGYGEARRSPDAVGA